MQVEVSVYEVPMNCGYSYARTMGGLGIVAVPMGEPDPYGLHRQSVFAGDVLVEEASPGDSGDFLDYHDAVAVLPDGRRAYMPCVVPMA